MRWVTVTTYLTITKCAQLKLLPKLSANIWWRVCQWLLFRRSTNFNLSQEFPLDGVYMYICIYVYMYICIYVYIHIHMYTYKCEYVYVCMFVCTYVCVYTYIRMYISTCMYLYVYIYINIYI
jgi:hypothetical protein